MSAKMREQTVLPPEDGRNLLGALAKQLTAERPSGHALLLGPEGEEVELPEPVYRALQEVVTAMAQGMAITVAPHNTMLTTQEAADMLGVSRPTLIKLLSSGEISYSMHGRHRRVRLADVVAYQQRTRQEREAALHEMAVEGEEAGFYEDTLQSLPEE
ncbi:helix-turn-helix domain-containing protein [Bounagaea algeriensis]